MAMAQTNRADVANVGENGEHQHRQVTRDGRRDGLDNPGDFHG